MDAAVWAGQLKAAWVTLNFALMMDVMPPSTERRTSRSACSRRPGDHVGLLRREVATLNGLAFLASSRINPAGDGFRSRDVPRKSCSR